MPNANLSRAANAVQETSADRKIHVIHQYSGTTRDFAPQYVETPRARYLPGIYNLRCISARPRRMFDAHKLELKLQFAGTTDCVFAYLHLGREVEPEVRPGSDYARLWLEANGGKKARRMSARLFRWAWFECRIGDCTKTHDGNTHAEPYSVAKILRFVQR